MNEDRAVLTAVYWWSDKISEKLQCDIDDLRLIKFREKLSELIYSAIATDLAFGYDGASIWIYGGDSPHSVINRAAASAGIQESIFPQYVNMIIDSYDGGETYEVQVSDKSGEPYKGLYPVYIRK